MSTDNDYRDLGRVEDDFNDFLDTLARGESTEAIDIDPSLAVTAKRVHGMAARTYPEAHLMYRTWSTVGASGNGELTLSSPVVSAPVSSRRALRPRTQGRNGSWRFTNHAALAAVLIVALVTGFAGFHSGLPGGGSTGNMGVVASPQAQTPDLTIDLNCTTEPRTIEDVANVMTTPAAAPNANQITISADTPDAATIAAVQKTQEQLVACGEDPLRSYALYSDSCLRSELLTRYPDAELKPAIVGTEVAADATMMAGKRSVAGEFATPGAAVQGVYDVILARDIELLSDGRVGAIVRQVSVDGKTTLIAQYPRYRFFIKVGDQWRYDCDAPESHG